AILFALTVQQGEPLQQRCTFPPERGSCDKSQTKYAYDVRTGECVQFVYGGCGGNENRFDTKEECVKQCGWKFRHPR
ncbi:hypothetical protein P879_10903, partial [Paragonimus westermani]